MGQVCLLPLHRWGKRRQELKVTESTVVAKPGSDREPVCLNSQCFLIQPTFSPGDAVQGRLWGIRWAEAIAGNQCPWVSMQTLAVCWCCVYRDFCRFIPLHQGLCCFHGGPAGRHKQVRLVQTQRDVLGKQDSGAGDVR